MSTFVTKLSENDYQKLRYASMRGGFTYSFSRDSKNEVEFIVKEKEKQDFLSELEALFGSTEDSRWEDRLTKKKRVKNT